MREIIFGEVEVGQKFFLESEGELTEWEKITPITLPEMNSYADALREATGNQNLGTINATAMGQYIYVGHDETGWVKAK